MNGRILTDTEINGFCLWAAAWAAYNRPLEGRFLCLMYDTGARISDALNIGLWQVEPDGGPIVYYQIKTNVVRRFTPLTLSHQSAQLLAERHALQRMPPAGRIRYAMGSALSSAMPSTGEKDSILHLFRHNYARRLKAAGYSPAHIAYNMGLSKIDTAYTYTDSNIYIRNNDIQL